MGHTVEAVVSGHLLLEAAWLIKFAEACGVVRGEELI